MPAVNRIVGEAPPKLPCSLCGKKKLTSEFYTNPRPDRPGQPTRYQHACKRCSVAHRTLRLKGHTSPEASEILRRNGGASAPRPRRARLSPRRPAPVRLNRPGHKSRRRRNKQPQQPRAPRLPQFFYFVGEQYNPRNWVKVGIACDDGRLAELQTGNGSVLVRVKRTEVMSPKDAVAYETDIKRRYADYNVLNEWFVATPALLAELNVSRAEFLAALSA